MATGFGGTGTLKTHPNDDGDGYLEADYDGWYTAHSHASLPRSTPPAPVSVGARHRDALPGPGSLPARHRRRPVPKSIRGPEADAWEMLRRKSSNRLGSPRHRRCARAKPVTKMARRGSARGTTRRSMTSRRSPCCTRTRAARRQADAPSRADPAAAGRARSPRQAGTTRVRVRAVPRPPVLQDGFPLHAIHGQPLRQDQSCCRQCRASATTK